ncbi:MAG: SPFH domain-containing protein [Thermomicrobiales bacterium]|nr:SPFH domain-containing protein [Thermomicrobiales bacterium]
MAIIDVIELTNERPGEIVRRVPETGPGEFKLGSQLIVREGQRAVFVRDGKALDIFGPGRHTLSTDNIPLLTGLIGLPFGGRSPFTAEVYFVSMRDFTDLKWGTPQPLVYRDTELGMIRLRAFGTYAMRVADPQLFVNQIVGTRGVYSTSDIEDYLRSIILNEFNDLLGSLTTSILDIQGMTRELAVTARNALTDDFERLGLELRGFQISSITPPEAVQQRIDERSGMAALGDMGAYMQFKTAQAIGDVGAGKAGGGAGDVAATGVGVGAGIGMGAAMAGAVQGAFNRPAEQPASATATITCPNCHATIPAGSKFCPNCGQPLQPATVTCPNCGTANPAGAKFCVECGKSLTGS